MSLKKNQATFYHHFWQKIQVGDKICIKVFHENNFFSEKKWFFESSIALEDIIILVSLVFTKNAANTNFAAYVRDIILWIKNPLRCLNYSNKSFDSF